MSIKVIAYLNPLSSDRQEAETQPGKIRDILEKIDPHCAVQTGWRVLLNDEIITDFDRFAHDGDYLYVRLVPEGGDNQRTGGAMKAGGWFTVLVGIASFAIPVVGMFLGGALIGAGLSLALAGTVLLNYNIPGERKTPEQDPSIRGSRNQSRPMEYVPTLFGARRIYPDIAANSYTWVDPANGSQYLYQLFCCGQKDQAIDTGTIKIDETFLADYSATGDIDKVLSGNDPLIEMRIAYGESVPPLITKCVHEEQLNSVLKHRTDEGHDGAVVRTTPDKTTEINVDIFFYAGLGKYNDDGDVESWSVNVGAYYKQEGEPDSSYQLLGYWTGSSNTITLAELKTKRYAIHKTGLESGKWTVKVQRNSDDSDDNNVVDDVYVGSIRSIKEDAPVSADKCERMTLVGVKIKASEKLQNVIDRLNFVSQAKLPVYNGAGTGSEAWSNYELTDNPASAAMYAMTGDFAQQHLDPAEIDWPAFEKAYLWCKEHSYGCSEHLTDSLPINQLLTAIASTFRAEISRVNGKITVIQDIERDGFMQLFTPRNSHGYAETIVMADVPGAIAMGFVDRDAGFAENEATVYNTPTGNKGEEEPQTTQDCALWGVTDSRQARRLGMYKYAVIKNRPIIHKFSCDFEHLMCKKGDWIKYAGDIALSGISQGRIESLILNDAEQTTGIWSDELLEMEADKEYALRIRKKDGNIILVQLKTATGKSQRADFRDPIKQIDSPQEGNLFAFGTQGNETIDLVITDIQSGENLAADLTCVEYAPKIFGVDYPDFILPDFESNITDVAGVTDSGIANVSGWRTWYTYNDSKTQPARPSGDGNSDGWHRVSTSHSLWVSTKQSEDIAAGTWGPPIPTSQYVNDKIESGTDISTPDVPAGLSAVASQDGITLSCAPFVPGIHNTISRIVWQISKTASGGWTEFDSDGTSAAYFFNRATDGYPEASDLASWRVRAKSVNVWGSESKDFAGGNDGIAVDTMDYGTWQLSPPEAVVRVSARSITLQIGQPPRADRREVYGTIRHRVQIQKPEESQTWYKPAVNLNPYSSEDAWRDGAGYVEAAGLYTQTMPLTGQTITTETGDDGKKYKRSNPHDTLYRFKIIAFTQAGESQAIEINATAIGTNIQDIVHGSITHEAISTPSLSAISGNIGVISGGAFGDGEDNHWALDKVVMPQRTWYKGDFRAGGESQFIHIRPVVRNDEVVDYTITIQVGSFQISSSASTINGEIVIQKDERSNDRTRITPNGTYYEYRPSEREGWITIARQETRGLLSQFLYSHNSLVLSNADIAQRRSLGHDIGRTYLSADSRVYHFDTDLLDNKGRQGYDLIYDTDPPVLVGAENNTPSSLIDFTPAILAVSPYSETGRSLYGQYSITHPIGTSQTWTVDFWIEYIWAENQTLLDIGTESDRIQIIIAASEPNYNEPLTGEPTYNYEVLEKDKLVYNVAHGEKNIIRHQGLFNFEDVPFDELGIDFTPNTWIHLAVIMSETKISLYVGTQKVEFTRFSKTAADATARINPSKNSFILDEFFVDTKTGQALEEFAAETEHKIPWGSLDYKQKWYILTAENPENFRTNLFDSPVFIDAVKKIINDKEGEPV